MNEKHKGEFSNSEDKFTELGQQAGAVLGQLFAAAEQFGQNVSKESKAWSESQPSKEPFVTAMRQASEEFRATASRAAETLSDSFRNTPENTMDPDEGAADSADVDNGDIKPGNVRKIGGGSVESGQQSTVYASSRQSPAEYQQQSFDRGAHPAEHNRAEQLAEIFRSDQGLAGLAPGEFEALRLLMEKQYRSIREFQGKK